MNEEYTALMSIVESMSADELDQYLFDTMGSDDSISERTFSPRFLTGHMLKIAHSAGAVVTVERDDVVFNFGHIGRLIVKRVTTDLADTSNVQRACIYMVYSGRLRVCQMAALYHLTRGSND